jgi:hypothetical protein
MGLVFFLWGSPEITTPFSRMGSSRMGSGLNGANLRVVWGKTIQEARLYDEICLAGSSSLSSVV